MSTDDIDIDELMQELIAESELAAENSDYEDFLSEFIDNTLENLNSIETSAILLEKDPENSEVINNMFRYFHNIKGASSLVGQDYVKKIAHQTETLIDGFRKNTVTANKNNINLILGSVDYVRKICDDISLNDSESFLNEILLHLESMDSILNPVSIPAPANDTAPINAAESAIKVPAEESSINKKSTLSPVTGEMQQSGTDNKHLNKDCNYIINKINYELLQEFKLEIEDYLIIIKERVPELEKDFDKKLFNKAFRAVHSVTGLAGYAGYPLIRRITTQIESLLESGRRDEIIINKEIIDLILEAVNYISIICDIPDITHDAKFLTDIKLHLEKMNVSNFFKVITVDNQFWLDFIAETKELIDGIEVNALILEKENKNFKKLNAIFRSFHTIKGLASFVNQNLIQQIAHKTESILGICLERKIIINSDIVDLMLNASDCIKHICEDISLNKNQAFLNTINDLFKLVDHIREDLDKRATDGTIVIVREEYKVKKIGEILVDQNILTEQDVFEILAKQKNEYPNLSFGQIAIKENKAGPKDIINAFRTQQMQKTALAQDELIRVSAYDIDNLIGMIDDLTVARYMIEQEAVKFSTTPAFQVNLEKLSEIGKNIQNLSMFLKVASLKPVFQKLTRIARDTMAELKKDINFITEGEDIEIDRSIVDKILDPLLHLVRNSIYHGIEEKGIRIKTNKPHEGTVRVSAYTKKGKLYVEVSDDGRGLDIEKIYKKAVEKSLLDPEKRYSETEIVNCILIPGFSTVESADNVSGRGIGMDVVLTEIQKLGGKLEIYSKPGKGCLFITTIPLKDTVINGTIVDIYGSNYVIPTTNVKNIIKLEEKNQFITQNDEAMVRVDDKFIPLINTSEFLGAESAENNNKSIVILEYEQKCKALAVRSFTRGLRVPISPMEEELFELDLISGMSILGDGEMALILDIQNLFKI